MKTIVRLQIEVNNPEKADTIVDALKPVVDTLKEYGEVSLRVMRTIYETGEKGVEK